MDIRRSVRHQRWTLLVNVVAALVVAVVATGCVVETDGGYHHHEHHWHGWHEWH